VGTLKNIPDLAIEINLSSGGLDKLAVYQGLGVLVVVIWQDQQLTLYQLRETGYQKSSRSQFFPDLDWQLLAKYIIPQEQPQAIKAFLKAIHSSSN
jgi:Uma2 family endonuclease